MPRSETKGFIGLVAALPDEMRALVPAEGGGSMTVKETDGHTVRQVILPDGPRLVCVLSGVGPEKAAAAARWLIDEGASALVSAGIAGGLSPAFEPGDMVVGNYMIRDGFEPVTAPSGVVMGAERAMAEAGMKAGSGPIVTVDEPTLTEDAKRELAEKTGAVAVDMESHAVAEAASRAGLNFLVLRSICDGLSRTVSPHLAGTLDEDGRPRPRVMATAVIRRPWLLFHLFLLKRDFDSALNTLARGWHAQIEGGLAGLLAGTGRASTGAE